jgi:hypothetical protein
MLVGTCTSSKKLKESMFMGVIVRIDCLFKTQNFLDFVIVI